MINVVMLLWMVGWFALPAWIAWSRGEYAIAAAVFVLALLGLWTGHEAAWWTLRGEGYVVERRADAAGRMRWRVGVAGPPAPKPADTVEWITPGRAGRGRAG